MARARGVQGGKTPRLLNAADTRRNRRRPEEPLDAQDYLLGAGASPISGMLAWIATTPPTPEAVNVLVAWGELLIGRELMVGFLTRLAAFSGAFMMVLFYLGDWPVATGGTIVTDPFLYLLVFLVLAAFGAGRIVGLDRIVAPTSAASRSSSDTHGLGRSSGEEGRSGTVARGRRSRWVDRWRWRPRGAARESETHKHTTGLSRTDGAAPAVRADR